MSLAETNIYIKHYASGWAYFQKYTLKMLCFKKLYLLFWGENKLIQTKYITNPIFESPSLNHA